MLQSNKPTVLVGLTFPDVGTSVTQSFSFFFAARCEQKGDIFAQFSFCARRKGHSAEVVTTRSKDMLG
jgi:hypothetical protein